MRNEDIMRTRLICAVVVAMGLAVGVAHAARESPASAQSLATATRLSCTFTFYTVTIWDEGTPEVRTGDDVLTFEISAIDNRAHTAEIIAPTGAASVSLFLTDTGLNVIEQTPIGNFIVTTVFGTALADGSFPAVHSRHLGDVSRSPTPSQYFGSCQVAR
jgi:hypothetical protein